MRSKTTIVSWTENPITTRRATIKLISTNTFWVLPRIANSPTGKITSCARVSRVINPYFQDFTGFDTFLKAKVTYNDMAIITKPTAHHALVLNSFETIGLTDQKSSSFA